MQFDIPKIRKPLDLGDYSPELRGQFLYVWVNPPRKMKDDYFSSTFALGDSLKAFETPERFSWAQRLTKGRQRKRSARKLVRWYAQLWSGKDGSSFGGDEIEAMAEKLIDDDPAMWTFLCNATWAMIGEWIETSKKVSTTRSSTRLRRDVQPTPS